ncbi:hypothetical protein SLEP1_g22479 [Rubroshorea leprosula]|uniref:Uncharacterized protein n=1 Tax=Rubroshorea leprosula TaxID=152421 RepID=A0AAV5JIK9_9ROSI|nr:hypothetical protein SLEP1_g22479 [Rubroshorea leprosula]
MLKLLMSFGNQTLAADQMAKLGQNLSEDFVIFHCFPPSLKVCCIVEIMEIEFRKTC